MSNSATFSYILMFVVITFGLLALVSTTSTSTNQNSSLSSLTAASYQCLSNGIPANICQFPQWSPPQPANTTATKQGGQTPLQFVQCIVTVGLLCQGSVIATLSNTGQAIFNGASYALYAFGFFGGMILAFFAKIFSLLGVVLGIDQSLNSSLGVPFLGVLFFGFQVLLVVYGVAILKPGGHGQ